LPRFIAVPDVLYLKEPCPDYIEAAVDTVLRIHAHEPPGDILVFMTGAEEIETVCDLLKERSAGCAAASVLVPVPVSVPVCCISCCADIAEVCRRESDSAFCPFTPASTPTNR
jgi:HrpA-like RNA helicase